MPRRPADPALLARFGSRVREIRKARGLTQQGLADRLRVRSSTVSELETGAVSPTLTTVFLLARELGVEVTSLFVGTPPPEPPPPRGYESLTDSQRAAVDGIITAMLLGRE
jgi:transcriptional regulator with XRE-family HTH domain